MGQLANPRPNTKFTARKQVLIQVVGTQKFPEGEEECLEFVTLGTYHERQGVFYVVYKESVITGLEGVTTSLRIGSEQVTLNRMGQAELKQEFQLGVLHKGRYVTPFGTLWLSVLTNALEYDLTAQGGRISLEYDLFVDDKLVSHNGLKMLIKEEPPR